MKGLTELVIVKQNKRGDLVQLNLNSFIVNGRLCYKGIDMVRQLRNQGLISIKESSCRAKMRKDNRCIELKKKALGKEDVKGFRWIFPIEKVELTQDYLLELVGNNFGKTFIEGGN